VLPSGPIVTHVYEYGSRWQHKPVGLSCRLPSHYLHLLALVTSVHRTNVFTANKRPLEIMTDAHDEYDLFGANGAQPHSLAIAGGAPATVNETTVKVSACWHYYLVVLVAIHESGFSRVCF
jgi:hypothetical protein